jgi:lipoyl(octanoyl) transferase
LGIGVKAFVEKVEQCIIDVLQLYGIVAERIPNRIGIWIDKDLPNERKIAAIGIKCSRHMTMHGLAFNINTDLSLFNQIIPCGIVDKGVSSLAKEIGREIPMSDIKNQMVDAFSRIFELQFLYNNENL